MKVDNTNIFNNLLEQNWIKQVPNFELLFFSMYKERAQFLPWNCALLKSYKNLNIKAIISDDDF